ncbi:hypothetical protein [Actinacidiphila yeochonensis]|uniref:hypothetical protein n=1 Tax=Actinacidiphila yeochonensis TaxID=89050 RepID=UPI0012FEE920|nr:hypothetical protein [Actinacidiphila yeochonensis]
MSLPDAEVSSPDALVSLPEADVSSPDALVSPPVADVPSPDTDVPLFDGVVSSAPLGHWLSFGHWSASAADAPSPPAFPVPDDEEPDEGPDGWASEPVMEREAAESRRLSGAAAAPAAPAAPATRTADDRKSGRAPASATASDRLVSVVAAPAGVPGSSRPAAAITATPATAVDAATARNGPR